MTVTRRPEGGGARAAAGKGDLADAFAPMQDLQFSQTVDKVRSWAESNGTGDRKGVWGISGAAGTALSVAGTLALMFCCPMFAIYMWFTFTQLDGSLRKFVEFGQTEGFKGLWQAWPQPSLEAWLIVLTFGLFEAVLQRYVPGKRFEGPVTPNGNTPVYKANGVMCYLITLAAFLTAWGSGLWNPGRVYDLFGEMLAALNTFSLAFCVFLNIKGCVAPSSTDSGSTGSFIYNFFWGMELYPRIGKSFDLKTWTNCRMGMMGWAFWILCFAVKQYQTFGHVSNSMLVSVLLMEVYIFKFFLWETGYWRSMDIMHDRAGYYICWGCLVWVPAVYTSPAMYLTLHGIDTLSAPVALAIATAGIAAVYINYDSDKQRQVFRATHGKAQVWGKAPTYITAKYTPADGHEKTSLLLTAGWWGLARHFHYLPEIVAAFCWTAPALFGQFLPYFYVVFLTLLLTDRAFRDDSRCQSKYGKYWAEYCKSVPYKMVPYVF